MSVSLAKPVSLAKRNVKAIDMSGIKNPSGMLALLEDNDTSALRYLFQVQENGKFNAKMEALHNDTQAIGRF